MTDTLISALWRDKGIVVGVARTTDTVRQSCGRHGLDELATTALARLMTCTALLRFVQPRAGTLSLQMVCKGPLRQLFADIDHNGNIRGYARGATDMERGEGRLQLAKALKGGLLSVIRAQTQEQFSQSNVALTTCDVDGDVTYFVEHSDQIPSFVACTESANQGFGGLMVQCLPQADMAAFATLRAELTPKRLQAALVASPDSPLDWLVALVPQAHVLTSQVLRWQCRCSQARATAAVRLLPREELAAMAAADETATITCEFCSQRYTVAAHSLGSTPEG